MLFADKLLCTIYSLFKLSRRQEFIVTVGLSMVFFTWLSIVNTGEDNNFWGTHVWRGQEFWAVNLIGAKSFGPSLLK